MSLTLEFPAEAKLRAGAQQQGRDLSDYILEAALEQSRRDATRSEARRATRRNGRDDPASTKNWGFTSGNLIEALSKLAQDDFIPVSTSRDAHFG